MKLVVHMLYKEFFSSDVEFLVYTPMDKKWIFGVAFSNVRVFIIDIVMIIIFLS